MKHGALILAIWLTGLTAAPAQQTQPRPTGLTTPQVGAASVAVATPNRHRAGLYV
jgi:hypothetical protein